MEGNDKRRVWAIRDIETLTRREDFGVNYRGAFPAERDQFLYELATEYHERCERYDCGVCSGMRDGIAVPVNSFEMRDININARRVLNELAGRAAEKGISMDELTKEIQRRAP